MSSDFARNEQNTPAHSPNHAQCEPGTLISVTGARSTRKEIVMTRFFVPMKLAAAAALAAAIGVAGTPAHAILVANVLIANALTFNALDANGSALEDLNGVAIDAVTLPERAAGGPARGAPVGARE
jgi:hypothetical protein